MYLNGAPVPENGTVNVSEYPAIESGGSMALSYDMRTAVQSSNLSQTVACMIFTVSCDGHGALTGIIMTTAPTKTDYAEWDDFDPAGMVITAVYDNGTSAAVTGWTVPDGENLADGQQSVTVSYSEDGVTMTTTVPITVTKKIACAILYDTDNDGSGETLVFQRGITSDPTLTKIRDYIGFESKSYASTAVPWYNQRENITTVRFEGRIKPVSLQYWFNGFKELTTISGLEKLNTENCTNMANLFTGAAKLTSLDLSNWDTSKVVGMGGMFYQCYALTNVNLSGWTGGSVTNMAYMFAACTKLESVDLPGFDTSNVTNMNSMFYICNNITRINLAGWNTAKVTGMMSMFGGCLKLVTIYADSTFTTTAVTSSSGMFTNCNCLVGGCGLKFNPNYTDKTLARIDLSNRRGYFTQAGDPPYLEAASESMASVSSLMSYEMLPDLRQIETAVDEPLESSENEAELVKENAETITPATGTDLILTSPPLVPSTSTDLSLNEG